MLRRMRRPLLGFLALFAATTSGCCSLTPGPKDWLDVGFRSPAQCFHTFQVAIASEELDLEYRCLSSGFKRRNRLSQLALRELHDELESEMPWFRCISKAQVLEEHAISAERHLLIAEVSVFFHTQRFQVMLVREDFYETYRGAELLFDDAASWSELVRTDPDDPGTLEARVPSHGEFDPALVTELRVGREWKIDDFQELPEP